MISIEEISTLEGLSRMEAEWGRLLEESETDNIFLTFDWVLTWWRHFSGGKTLFILKVMNRDNLIGIAPLMIKKQLFYRGVFFIGGGVLDRMDFILSKYREKESILAILRYVMENSYRWDFVDLQEMPDTTGNLQILRECIKELNLNAISGDDAKSFYISFKDREAFFMTFSREARRQIRVGIKKLAKSQYNVSINTKDTAISPDNLLSEMERIENMSWKGRACVGIFSDKNTRSFHREIVKKYFKKGLVEIAFLSINGKNVAYEYDYFYNSRLYNYSCAYDSEYAGFSPGRMLMNGVLESCLNRTINEIDFLSGDEIWKSRLTSSCKIHARTQIFNRALYSRLLFIIKLHIVPCLKNKKIIYKAWINFKRFGHEFKRKD